MSESPLAVLHWLVLLIGLKSKASDVVTKLLQHCQSDKAAEDAANTTHAAATTTTPSVWCDVHKNSTHTTKDYHVVNSTMKKEGKWKKKDEEKNVNNAADSDIEFSSYVAYVLTQSYNKGSAYVVHDPKASGKSILIDSGTLCTMSCDASLFKTSSIRLLNPLQHVRLGNDSACNATHIGTLRL